MTSWITSQAGLTALRTFSPNLAEEYFNNRRGYVIGSAPAGWTTKRVANFCSYDDFVTAQDLAAVYVMYDLEKWPASPVPEQQHPTAFISAFATLAHHRQREMIAAPARDLMAVDGADYVVASGQTIDEAFLAAGLPAACEVADVYHCQAQADQPDSGKYKALVTGAIAQLPPGFPVWAGLTTMRGDPVSDMLACYRAVYDVVGGFWLNTTPATISVAAEFLAAVS